MSWVFDPHRAVWSRCGRPTTVTTTPIGVRAIARVRASASPGRQAFARLHSTTIGEFRPWGRKDAIATNDGGSDGCMCTRICVVRGRGRRSIGAAVVGAPLS